MASERKMLILAVYVDDIILAGKSEKRIADFKRELSEQFQVKDMGKLMYFLGVKVTKFGWSTNDVLQKFGMELLKLSIFQ